MPHLQKIDRSKSNGCLINNNGKPLFIKQPNIMELNALYQVVMSNIKAVDTIFCGLKKID
ncbi:MAG: hypothetical protein ABSA84_04450 [Gammaproteobacteria bacterium]|jgi:hypothetical protein